MAKRGKYAGYEALDPLPMASWKCLTELLQGPLRGRMSRDVVMDHSPDRYFHDHEHA